jgi:UDP-glucose 4-epimerase
MIKRILLTGASGFVSRALVPALLARGYQLRLPLRQGAAFPDLPVGSERIAIPDLETADWPAMMDGIDAVIHLAAIAHIGPSVPDDAYERGLGYGACATPYLHVLDPRPDGCIE